VQTDVTARIEAERALAARNARLDAVFALSPDGFALFDAAGRLGFANPALEALLDEPGGALLGLDRATFEARLAARCAPASVGTAGTIGSAATGAIVDAPEAAGAARAVAAPIAAGPDGVRVIALQRPVARVLHCTERSNAGPHPETLLCFRDVTRETEVDRMKSEFLTTAAHELRTPLASVFGYAELLLAREVDAPRRQRMLATIHAQAKLLTAMIDDLLDLAKIEARGERELTLWPTPVGLLVDGALEALAALDGSRPIELELADRDVEVAADPDRTRQALTNVLSNACRYSAPGTPVRLSTRIEPGFVVATVTDRGIGMDEAQRRRAFERFYRADPSGHVPGTGLGLSIAREVLDRQGGSITLRSTPGAGTEVELRLPLAPAEMRLPTQR
jgi:signal transduction histidine kinase